ncbi:hypothetical protein ACFY36_07925 [Actinoplanes sp. NPDC000266]
MRKRALPVSAAPQGSPSKHDFLERGPLGRKRRRGSQQCGLLECFLRRRGALCRRRHGHDWLRADPGRFSDRGCRGDRGGDGNRSRGGNLHGVAKRGCGCGGWVVWRSLCGDLPRLGRLRRWDQFSLGGLQAEMGFSGLYAAEQTSQLLGVACLQAPVSAGFVIATEFCAAGGIVPRLGRVTHFGHFRPGEELQLRHEQFSREPDDSRQFPIMPTSVDYRRRSTADTRMEGHTPVLMAVSQGEHS